MNIDRTRVVFFAIVGLALLIVCGVLGYNFASGYLKQVSTPPTALATSGPVVVGPTATVALTSPKPVFAPNAKLDDNLPQYICGADSFGSYFTLQQMQMSGNDVKHGFHLGIVPFFLDNDPAYDVSEEQRTALLGQGKWDCLLTTLDSAALTSPGLITAGGDERAGADQLCGRDAKT